MKLNFTVEEWKEYLESGESDEMFFGTLKDLGLDVEKDFKQDLKRKAMKDILSNKKMQKALKEIGDD